MQVARAVTESFDIGAIDRDVVDMRDCHVGRYGEVAEPSAVFVYMTIEYMNEEV